jgi:hypothetical protein
MKKNGKPPIGKLHRDSIKRVSQTPKAAPGFPRAYPGCGSDHPGAEKKPK